MVVLFDAAVAAGVMTPEALFAEAANSVNLGIGGEVQTMPHCKSNVYLVEYERMIGPKIAVLGRGSEVYYTFDDGNYFEIGRPRGVDIGALLSRRRLEGILHRRNSGVLDRGRDVHPE